jgi:hypothetical protein
LWAAVRVAKLHALMPTAEHPEDDRPTATAAVVRSGEQVSVLGRSPGPAAPGFTVYMRALTRSRAR